MANRVASYLDFATARAGDLYRSACLLTGGDTHLAEDLVQETLARVFVRWRLMSGADNPAAYTQTMLVRTALSWRRRRSSSERPTGELFEASGVEDGDTALRVTLMDALAQLPTRDRAVLAFASATRLSDGTLLLVTHQQVFPMAFWEVSVLRPDGTVVRLSETGPVRDKDSPPLLPLAQLKDMALSPLWTR